MNIASFAKVDAISEITRDIGQVFFASMFVAPIMQAEINWAITLSGFILSIIFWVFSILISEK
ncbi:MAG: hypothetical protein WCJ74_00170 [bacterium]